MERSLRERLDAMRAGSLRGEGLRLCTQAVLDARVGAETRSMLVIRFMARGLLVGVVLGTIVWVVVAAAWGAATADEAAEYAGVVGLLGALLALAVCTLVGLLVGVGAWAHSMVERHRGY
jgi:hypothetical protein